MQLKERFQRQLKSAREFSERMLSDFKTPEDFTRQVYPGSNHALWFAGHMGNTDNFAISFIAPELAVDSPKYQAAFGVGSQPTDNPVDYPPPEEVLAWMRERRTTLMQLLDGFSEEDFARPTPDGAPEFLANFEAIFDLAVWHERMHCGQLTVHRRAAGHPPLMGPPKSDESGA